MDIYRELRQAARALRASPGVTVWSIPSVRAMVSPFFNIGKRENRAGGDMQKENFLWIHVPRRAK